MKISKTDYLKFIQCSKYLWLNKKKPELLPAALGGANLRFAAGYEVENLAYKQYPDGISADNKNWAAACRRTKKLIKEKRDTIFQASVSTKNANCRTDIIRYNQELDAWDIIEVKSTSRLKDAHIDDICFQKICLESVGIKVGKMYLMHLNKRYPRHGDIDVFKLFTTKEVSEEVKRIEDKTKIGIKGAQVALNTKDEPHIIALRQCYKPYDCPFISYCHKGMPRHSIYSIGGALGAKKLATLLGKGITEVKDIPPEFLTTPKTRKHHQSVTRNTPYIEKRNIKKRAFKNKISVILP